ncbi:SpdD-like protein [Streptomyces sp. NPDC021100]|uniref:SpdD-like protein n=1 Tax=Streptomyces sp. NPDC021100 TaxID=3365114 RepID=UPI003798955F
MLRPKIPVNPHPTGQITPPTDTTPDIRPTPPAPAPVASRPALQLTPATAVALVGGGTAAVLVVGAVLVSMLLAVAITGMAVAIVAVILRLLLKDLRNH